MWHHYDLYMDLMGLTYIFTFKFKNGSFQIRGCTVAMGTTGSSFNLRAQNEARAQLTFRPMDYSQMFSIAKSLNLVNLNNIAMKLYGYGWILMLQFWSRTLQTQNWHIWANFPEFDKIELLWLWVLNFIGTEMHYQCFQSWSFCMWIHHSICVWLNFKFEQILMCGSSRGPP